MEAGWVTKPPEDGESPAASLLYAVDPDFLDRPFSLDCLRAPGLCQGIDDLKAAGACSVHLSTKFRFSGGFSLELKAEDA
jgi:hypothetical protein